MVDYLEKYKPKLYYMAVRWKPSEHDKLKCNTDGASKGNSRKSSYDLCIRNHDVDLVYVQGEEINETTNMEVEAIAIREAIYHCTAIGITWIDIETNSLVLVKILLGIWEISW
ncbi:hypothetical protein R3W88_024681 [Solanum pinnatisectum]|uniref:RNase H type-1 domain-containing protein n=1 Tax=Solanum pinnatisectum TaxID=50273 RepID=A0AAV9M0V7_9SOLN|nr:hypothetical protein R3W88_024681 [Solanum pinnatisectum]